MANFYKDNPDLRFYLEDYIDWEPLIAVTERDFTSAAPSDLEETTELYGDILELVGNVVGDAVAPHARAIDSGGVTLVDGEAVHCEALEEVIAQLKALDLHGMCLPRELEGQNAPLILFYSTLELLARADVSVAAHHGFHGGMAMAALIYSIQEGTTEFDKETGEILSTRFPEAIAEMRDGEEWGSMDITEPDAGSDMAKLRCVGVKGEDGAWRVSGTKIFITSGHGKYHYVIARTSATMDDGLGGLSMFLVPAWEDVDGERVRFATIDRLEEKLGHHGSATCALNFEDAPAHLIGKPGEGFKYMLLLMNNARLGVGFECLGLMEAALRAAKDYATERRTMGKSIDQHEMIADYLDEMESDIIGVRALAFSGAYAEEMSQKIGMLDKAGILDKSLGGRRIKATRGKHKAHARRVTPLLKYLAAEKAVELSRRSLQIHGGNGYTKDYLPEKLLRDAMVMPIYEGTSQIQALMVIKDTLGTILKNPQRFVRRIAQARWRALSANDPLERRVARLRALSLGAQQHILTRTVTDKYRALQGKPLTAWPSQFLKNWDPKYDFAYAMLHAERLTRILVDEAICEQLLEQAERFPERAELLERYLERAEPRARYLNDQIVNTGERLLTKLGRLHGRADEERVAS